jgi:hypothetical protein
MSPFQKIEFLASLSVLISFALYELFKVKYTAIPMMQIKKINTMNVTAILSFRTP